MEKVLVIGAARSGIAVSRLLLKKGYQVILTDANSISEKKQLEKEGIHVVDGGHPDYLLAENYVFVVKNPGIPYHVPFVRSFVEKQVKIYSEIEIAYRYSQTFTFFAITGTNGKTTTVSLLAHILSSEAKVYTAGNIGIPLSELVLHYEGQSILVVLELSNFQLLGIESFRAKMSVITNLSPDHLDYMESLDAYYKSKLRIYENSTGSDIFLKNIDDLEVMKYCSSIPCPTLTYSLKQAADIYVKSSSIYYRDCLLFEKSDLQIVGEHNLMNAIVAATMAYLYGISIEHIRKALQSFKAVEHRLEYVGEIKQIQFYNDSKATNPEAVVPALQAFEKNVIILVGGYDKQLPFDVLKPYITSVKLAVAFGQTKKQFSSVFQNVVEKDTLAEAFAFATKQAHKGDIILLSPGCASYDQFKSYEERGKTFKKLVNEYIKEETKC